MYDMVTIVGPTACGKTSLAVSLACRLGTGVISADSRQVYRRMDLGTGKDLSDYVLPDGRTVPYWLIDIAEPGYKYNVFEYQRDFLSVYNERRAKGEVAVLCGGTGMYIEAVLRGFRLVSVPVNEQLRSSLEGKSLEELTEMLRSYKTLHNTSDVDTVKRAIRGIEIEEYYASHPPKDDEFPKIRSLVVGVLVDRELRRERISQRLRQRLDAGMVDEVRALLNEGIAAEDLIYYGLEYKYITQYLTGMLTYDEMVRQLEIAIHQFAKRQMTWFRGMERRGIPIHWIDGTLPTDEKVSLIMNLLENEEKENDN
ncbi:MAG: tRNA (adenosine(37)-N6)-dimethylallyltransferase MiaA [Bacteroidaceae bacterium]|nr:tRNA (adenosine(37)-N6)-dimethylallyltransferase MiaA [Bacteroidaceae bacterium]